MFVLTKRIMQVISIKEDWDGDPIKVFT